MSDDARATPRTPPAGDLDNDPSGAGPRLADLSEGEILRRILPLMPSGPGVTVPPGDDAGVLATPSGSVVATTDSMVRDRDWRDDWSTGREVGLKLVAQNIADIAAMGAVPTGLLVSLMADPALPLAWVEDLARGIGEGASDAGCPVLGGDLSSAGAGVVVVSMTALGDLQGRTPVLRSGARVGDVVAVCGSLGWSGAGLASYAAGQAAPDPSPGAAARDRAVSIVRGFHRSPRPPWEAGPIAAVAGATAMLDLSDGLVRDGGRIASASGVTLELSGALLREHFLLASPLEEAVGAEEAWRQILSGGEEHSLLATFPRGVVPTDGRAPWRVIGRCVAPGPEGPEVRVDGIPPAVAGWDHFRP